MRSTTDMFEESENRKAFEDMLERRNNGARDMFQYQTPQEKQRDAILKGYINKLLDELEALPGNIDRVVEILSTLDTATSKSVLGSLQKGHSVQFTEGWEMDNKGQWIKKAIPIISKHMEQE